MDRGKQSVSGHMTKCIFPRFDVLNHTLEFRVWQSGLTKHPEYGSYNQSTNQYRYFMQSKFITIYSIDISSVPTNISSGISNCVFSKVNN